jgi:preprotein translocase subunit SecA
LRGYSLLREKILNLGTELIDLSEDQLKEKINEVREKLQIEKDKNGIEKALNKFLVPVYALVKEVIFRKTGLSLFPTQIFGGIVLHNGNIAQMNTGEGKTLTGLLPVCLNALSGNSVYVVTVNEYLANRD